MTPVQLDLVRPLLEASLREDIGPGDITSEAVVDTAARARGEFLTRDDVVVCGLPIIEEVVRLSDPALRIERLSEDGAGLSAGGTIAALEGNARSILAVERVALNFLQRLTGIATATRAYVSEVEGTRARILDTRKTVPGYRFLDKYAVRCGGGTNHRSGLFDSILIKNNHLVFHSGPAVAVRCAREHAGADVEIEVEVRSLDELRGVLDSGATRILIDNFDVRAAGEAVSIADGRVPLEASGGITLESVRSYAETGVDYISVGALTHSVRAADIHLALIPC